MKTKDNDSLFVLLVLFAAQFIPWVFLVGYYQHKLIYSASLITFCGIRVWAENQEKSLKERILTILFAVVDSIIISVIGVKIIISLTAVG